MSVAWYLVETYPEKKMVSFQTKPDYAEPGQLLRLVGASDSMYAIGKLTSVQSEPPENVPIVRNNRILRPSQFMSQLMEVAPFEAGTILNEIFGMFTLSEDKKVLMGYDSKKNPDPHTIVIPKGVVQIADGVFAYQNFWYMYIPDSTVDLGNSVLYLPSEYVGSQFYTPARTNIKKISVASGNPYFAADDIGFYSIKTNGIKESLYRFPQEMVKEAKENVREGGKGILAGYEFSVPDDEDQSIKDIIRRNGGTIVAEMGDMTDFLIMSKVDPNTEESAKKLRVRIMPKEVLHTLCKDI